MSFCPDNVGNWSPSPKNESGLYYLNQYGRWFPSTAPREKRKVALDRFWIKLRRILTRGRSIFQIVGAKAHANVLKGTFSKGCTFNCIRSGVTNTIVNTLGKVGDGFLTGRCWQWQDVTVKPSSKWNHGPVPSTTSPTVDSYRPVPPRKYLPWHFYRPVSSRKSPLTVPSRGRNLPLPSRPVYNACPCRPVMSTKPAPAVPSRRRNLPIPSLSAVKTCPCRPAP